MGEATGWRPLRFKDRRPGPDGRTSLRLADQPLYSGRRAIVIEALHGLVRVLEREDSEAAAEQASGSDERGGLKTAFSRPGVCPAG
jgi:hypothetical protein